PEVLSGDIVAEPGDAVSARTIIPVKVPLVTRGERTTLPFTTDSPRASRFRRCPARALRLRGQPVLKKQIHEAQLAAPLRHPRRNAGAEGVVVLVQVAGTIDCHFRSAHVPPTAVTRFPSIVA